MTSQLSYLIAQQSHIELSCRAEQARLANEARTLASPASTRRRHIGRLLAPRRLRAARLAAAVAQASPGPPHECLSCDI
jgi:hypothetical protein